MKNIDLKIIEELADKMNEKSLSEISIEIGEEKLTLVKEERGEIKTYEAPKKVEKKENIKKEVIKEVIKGNVVVSPTVGTFYSSPAPEEAPFVMEGSSVEKGQTLCIIEAMKMMNEVVSSFDGKISKIFVADGVIVQKGQELFVIE